MISRPISIALILAAYLLVAVTFAYFALRMQTVHDFLIDLRDRQVNVLDRHLGQQDELYNSQIETIENHLVRQDLILQEIKKHCDSCTHTSE